MHTHSILKGKLSKFDKNSYVPKIVEDTKCVSKRYNTLNLSFRKIEKKLF